MHNKLGLIDSFALLFWHALKVIYPTIFSFAQQLFSPFSSRSPSHSSNFQIVYPLLFVLWPRDIQIEKQFQLILKQIAQIMLNTQT